ncbi:uncharacterized protein PQBP1 [Drosophila bipectinata]|uniref:uncharacterized protein PQBP1 n=1 Tax=Drosophila bipectinata TaxID=42026 RepID=UPI0007E6B503|nr:uncharacterized protein LOC108129920 [Drosophila bipectinata]KAH8236620.1 hypothetical protein KR026_006941 [Drosophila bipectinata]
MSLPAALLQRLKKRGLVTKQSSSAPASEAIEEIIAENYDDDDKNSSPYVYKEEPEPKRKNPEEQFWSNRIKERIGVNESHHGYKLCPNKYNIWHKCSLYCVNRWTNAPNLQPSQKYLKRYKRLLRKYPLESSWKDVYDKGCKAYYFFNTTTQMVSWLPPSHPKARVTPSAAVFRRQLANSNDEFNFDSQNLVLQKTSGGGDLNDGENPFSSSVYVPAKKQKSRDLDRKLQRRRRNEN